MADIKDVKFGPPVGQFTPQFASQFASQFVFQPTPPTPPSDLARFYERHKHVLQQVLAGIDPINVTYPNTSDKWWQSYLRNPFATEVLVYQLSYAVWKNVDEFLLNSGWLPILQQLFRDELVLLGDVTASCDSLPVLYKGAFYRMFVGGSNSIVTARFGQSLPRVNYNGRVNYLVAPNTARIDLVTWLDSKPSKEDVFNVMAALDNIEYRLSAAGYNTTPQVFIDVHNGTIELLPGNDFALRNVWEGARSSSFATWLSSVFRARGYNFQLNLAPLRSTSDVPATEYTLPEIRSGVIEGVSDLDQVRDDSETKVISNNRRLNLMRQERASWLDELLSTILSTSGWQPEFSTAISAQDLYKMAVRTFRRQLDKTPYVRFPRQLVFNEGTARYYQASRADMMLSDRINYTFDSIPSDGSLSPERKIRIFSPLVFRAVED